jgi:uncharacterized membrane protein YhaH (DUF805 family)
MNITESVTSVLKNYANFDGRARRSEYWWFFLVNILLQSLLYLVSPILANIVGLALFIPGLAVAVRRMHDIGKSGWYLLVAFIPLAGIIWLIVLLVTDGQSGTNEYGPDPKGSGLEDEIDSIGKN